MSKPPFFSIIIPTYNRAGILPRAIRSVLDQTYTSWELIVVDDGSQDETKKVVSTFLDNKNIRYHRQQNKELNAARNTGISLSRGQYLLFLDDDDVFLPRHLSVLYSHIINAPSPVPVLRTGMILKNGQQEKKGIFYHEQNESAISFLWHKPVNLLSFAFHQSIFKELTFDEQFLLGDDVHFLMQLFSKYPLVQIEKYTVVYHLHETNRTALYYQKHHLENKFKAMETLWDICGDVLREHITEKSVKAWKLKQLLHFSRAAFRHNDYALGWFYYKVALKNFTFNHLRSFIRTAIVGVLGV